MNMGNWLSDVKHDRRLEYEKYIYGSSSYFLKELIKDNNNNIMICDGPGSFPKMLNTRHRKIKKF